MATVNLTSLFVAAGLPEPVAEFRFHPKRRWRFDFAWPEFKVSLEQEGATWTHGRHTRGRGYSQDCEKYNAAAIMGWIVIRATTQQLQSGEAFQWVRAALAARAER